jgi:hypothetical protein
MLPRLGYTNDARFGGVDFGIMSVRAATSASADDEERDWLSHKVASKLNAQVQNPKHRAFGIIDENALPL